MKVERVILRLDGLRRFRSAIRAQLTGNAGGPVADALKKWAFRYRTFVQLRFDRLSKSGGGGEWPPLKQQTKLGRVRQVSRLRFALRAGHVTQAEFDKRLKAAVAKARKARRAIRAGKDKTSILRDTGTLFAALNPEFTGQPGALEHRIPFGVRVGFGGPARHPSSKRASIAEIASYHNAGTPNNRPPKRSIIVPPDQKTLAGMAADIQTALGKLLG